MGNLTEREEVENEEQMMFKREKEGLEKILNEIFKNKEITPGKNIYNDINVTIKKKSPNQLYIIYNYSSAEIRFTFNKKNNIISNIIYSFIDSRKRKPLFTVERGKLKINNDGTIINDCSKYKLKYLKDGNNFKNDESFESNKKRAAQMGIKYPKTYYDLGIEILHGTDNETNKVAERIKDDFKKILSFCKCNEKQNPDKETIMESNKDQIADLQARLQKTTLKIQELEAENSSLRAENSKLRAENSSLRAGKNVRYDEGR